MTRQKSDLSKFLSALGLNADWKLVCSKLPEYSNNVHILITELKEVHGLKETIEKIEDDHSADMFFEDVDKFFGAYGCPYSNLTEGPISERFSSFENKVLLLQYLCSEVLAARRIAAKEQTTQSVTNSVGDIKIDDRNEDFDHEIFDYLIRAFKSFELTVPSEPINLSVLFSTLRKKVTAALERCPLNYMGKPILPLTGISDRQWSQISRIAAVLQQEYASRQATLLKRLDVTVQSFKWSEKAKSQLELISSVYNPIRNAMGQICFPSIPNLLAVRDNSILCIEKTSGASARRFTACDLNKILIGKVPDRGGRAWELEPPPPEMPSFKQRQPDRGGGGGRGRGGGGGPPVGAGRGQSAHSGSNRGGSGYDRIGNQVNYMNTPYMQTNTPTSYIMNNGGYMMDPNSMLSNQQMCGLGFEPGLSVGHTQGYTFQPTNNFGAGDYGQSQMYRGGGGGGGGRGRGGRGRGRPY